MKTADEYWWYHHVAEDNDWVEPRINEFFTTILRTVALDGAALGITKLVLDQGLDVLSPKQAYVFDQEVIEPHAHQQCGRCSQDIPWDEMLFNDGWCSYCYHLLQKDD